MAQVVANYGLQGNAAPSLYALAATNGTTGAFEAAPLANTTNSVVCSGTSTACTGGYLQSGGKKAYTITSGATYSMAAGLGSVNATKLVAAWKVPATIQTTTALTVSNAANVALASGATVVHGSYLNFKALVQNTGGDSDLYGRDGQCRHPDGQRAAERKRKYRDPGGLRRCQYLPHFL